MRLTIPAAPLAFVVTFALASVAALALSARDIQYPVAELGNCDSEFKCGVYCGDPAHKAECDAFIEKYNLDEKSERIKSIEFPIAELGNCGSRAECEAYCNEPDNVEACIEFAKEHRIINERDYEHADNSVKMARLVAEGKTPGGCQSESECIEYCMMDEHFDECLKFVEENDIVSERELKFFKERRSFRFEGPGGCSGERECKEYCSIDENFGTCVDFMEENGFMSSEEAQRLRQIGSFSGPGGCKMDECRDFCENPDNFETCISWAHENGMISDRDYELAKKTGGKGPGGCVRDECRTYCENPDHGEECFKFACENGFMTEEQCSQGLEMMKRGFEGPGGCRGPEECEKYCRENPDACRGTGPGGPGPSGYPESGGYGGGEFAGPGGCKSPEECKSYCDSHPESSECGGRPDYSQQQPQPGSYPQPSGEYPQQYPQQYPQPTEQPYSEPAPETTTSGGEQTPPPQ